MTVEPQENIENQENLEELLDDDNIDLNSFNELSTGDLLEDSGANKPKDSTKDQPHESVTDAPKQISELLAQIINLKQQSEEKDNQYKRLFADFDNFRKRTEREKEDEESKFSAKILKKFLNVVDDFERAQSQIKPKTDGETTIHNSYQSVYKQLVKSLKENGVTRMRVLNEVFDPNLHEAIAQEPSSDHEDGAVMDELRPGYLLGERVLRHALVRVAMAMAANATENPNPPSTEN